MGMRLGISSYTYVWSVGVPGQMPELPMTAYHLLNKATELGVHVLQIADNLPFHHLADHHLEALIDHARQARIDLELGTCGIDADNLQRNLQLAVRVGSPILRTVLDTPTRQPGVDEVVAVLRPLMPAFKRAGVRLAIENHDRFKAATLAMILDRLSSSAVGICLDTANSIGCVENLDTLLNTLGPRVVNLHIKDYAIFRPEHLKGFVVEGRPAGQGQLEIPALLNRVKGFDPNVNAILELWPPPEPDLADSIAKEESWTRQSIEYLRRLIPD
jgi:sugar phosphate isomerase/epimerase